MKKICKFLFSLVLIVLISFIVVRFSDKYKIKISKNNIECTIVAKGCDEGKALAYYNDEVYIAYGNYIKLIDSEGKEHILYKTTEEIEDIECYSNSILIISGNKLVMYYPTEEKEKVILSNIPYSGNGVERKLLVSGEYVYITIGALSNSGIKEDGSIEDTTKLNDNLINNATVYKLSLTNMKLNRFATGIRGITGIDINSKDEIYAIFTGMLDEGERPVSRDKDYIYVLEKSHWYGWPDFSGGDYINSPRFAKEDLIKPIIDNPILKVVDGPIYVDDNIDSLRELAIDRDGILLPKDSIIFWDKCNNSITGIVDNKSKLELLKLVKKSNVEDIVYYKDGFLILDSQVGCIYSLHQKIGFFKFRLPLVIKIYIFLLIGIIIIILIKKRESKEVK